MAISRIKADERVVNLHIDDAEMTVALMDGRSISVPLASILFT